ncbi:MAG: DUF4147 domain-containing protein [Candidatus Latescibacteria bacterium]|nr:DUF4147 domain-containing protein [Candidatus Latescibacterota bacterium]
MAKLRTDALTIFQAGLQAGDPHRCIDQVLSADSTHIHILDNSIPIDGLDRLLVVGAGKATSAMATAVEAILGDFITAGAINTKYQHSLPLNKISTTECAHPLPDQQGVVGTQQMLELVADLTERDLVLCLLSGGGSALMPAPVEGISLEAKQQTTQLLLRCGASIDEINAIRKHLSRVKGGLLARHAAPARLFTLALSDVIGDRLDTIASGPTYPDSTRFADCLQILDYYDLSRQIPTAVHRHLQAGAAGQIAETAMAAEPCFQNTTTQVIGNNSLALEAARQQANVLGYTPLVLSSRIAGETRDIAGVHTAIAQEIRTSGQPLAPPACIISGGETTVTLKGQGKGGRNQEFALAAALELDQWSNIVLLSGGTDGTDGPTDAAGAIVDGATISRSRQAGLEAADYLARNDAYPFFAALDDLLITGPTGTNVMDLRLVLVV